MLREAEGLREELELWRNLESRARSTAELLELAQEENDQSVLTDVDTEAQQLAAEYGRARRELLFGGEYDQRNALLTISAGAGGTEATDWAEMLLRMYLRWAERHRFATEILDQTEGEETGIKSVTVAVDGRAAYGYLKAERGVHRLVRISPFDSQKRRHTTFALVEVLPEVESELEVELNWDETQNKETAAKILQARLLERAVEEHEAEIRKLRGEHVEAGWGNQIRSYVLHPYQMVKDHRTEVETGNTAAVLDGDLDTFMQAELEREATGAVVAGSRPGPDDR